jgi:hypothetical protein
VSKSKFDIAQRPERPRDTFLTRTPRFFVAAWSKLVRLEANSSAAIFRGGCRVAPNLPAGAARLAYFFLIGKMFIVLVVY